MSVGINTDLGLAPSDYAKKKVKKLLEDSWIFEFQDDSKPDEDGLIHLLANDYESYDDLEALRGMGIPFFARYDSRLEAEGNQWAYVAYRRRYVFTPEAGNGMPVVIVRPNGKIDKEDMKSARLFYKLLSKVISKAMKELQETCCDCGKPLMDAETMSRNNGRLSHLEPCTEVPHGI